MKLGIISDTHGSLTAWQKAYENCFQDVDLIIHCGDVLYHGPRNPLPDGYNPKGLAGQLNALRKPLIIVRGNCDAEVDQLMLDYLLESPYAHIFTPAFKILAHHGHQWSLETIPAKVKETYNIIISGHTHQPGIFKIQNNVFLNPGSPALPKNNPPVPTAAVIDETTIRLINLLSGEEMMGHKLF